MFSEDLNHPKTLKNQELKEETLQLGQIGDLNFDPVPTEFYLVVPQFHLNVKQFPSNSATIS